MEWDLYVRAILALVFVLGLIILASQLLRRVGPGGLAVARRRPRRLALVETLSLDSRHRLVLVRRDGVEHLLLVGGASDLVVERIAAGEGGDTEAEARESR